MTDSPTLFWSYGRRHSVFAVGAARLGKTCEVPSPLHPPEFDGLGWPSTNWGAICPGVSVPASPSQSASMEHRAPDALQRPRPAIPKMRLWLPSTMNTCVGCDVLRSTNTPPPNC